MTDGLPVREGDLLAGKYRVERVLGAGGMGIVVCAMHEQLEQRVAIKFVRDEALGNQDAVERFLREARAAVKLKSEHAAKVLDVGTLASGAPYMVMEYLEGSDLGKVLEESGPVSVQLAAEWMVQACEAIAEAHATGIVHRDIKPQNLFLARSVGGQGKVKVLDFGVSKSLTGTGAPGGLTQTRSMLGSPLYMAPEQMRSSRDVDARADVWAMGVVLYELLTTHWPFEAESMPELCLKVVGEAPVPLTTWRTDLPQAVIDVVDCCLQKDASKRYANAAELASALEPFAPPASRVIAERARLVMTASRGGQVSSPGLAGMALSAKSGVVVSQQQGADVLAQTAPTTPAAWDSGKAESPVSSKKRPATLWVGVAAVACVAVGAGFFVVRGASRPAVAASPSPLPPPASAVLPMTPPTVTIPPVASVAPPPSASATTGVGAAAGSVPVPRSVTPGPPVAKPGAVPRVPASGKAKPGDDDIPSLR